MAGKTLAQLTPDELAHLRARAKGNTWCVGRKFSEESRRKMSESMARRNERWRAEGRLLSPEEKAARKHVREASKRFIRRILTMTRIRKDKRSEELLGYTKQQLREHLEAQFKDGMSWENRDSFHIDHKIPVAEFFRQGVFDIAQINALSNLQVLTPDENRAKSDKVISFAPANRREVLTATFSGGTASYSNGA